MAASAFLFLLHHCSLDTLEASAQRGSVSNQTTHMKCPQCDLEMLEGKAHIGGGFSTLLTGGINMGNLTFKAPAWRGHVMQETSDVLTAHYCDHCGLVALESKRRGLSTLES